MYRPYVQSTLLLFKKNSSEKVILAGLGLEPTSPSSREEFAGALDHSATMTCSEIKLNKRIFINLKLAHARPGLEVFVCLVLLCIVVTTVNV